MTIKKLLGMLYNDTYVCIGIHGGGDAVDWIYEGTHKNVPYTIADNYVYKIYTSSYTCRGYTAPRFNILISKEDYNG